MKLIQGRKDATEEAERGRRIQKFRLWGLAHLHALQAVQEKAAVLIGTCKDEDLMRQPEVSALLVPAAVSGIKFVSFDENGKIARQVFKRGTLHDFHVEWFKMLSTVRHVLFWMNPRDFFHAFPADKTYDGGGEWQDYFSSMEAKKTAPDYWTDIDKFSVWLTEWNNRDIKHFCIACMLALSRLREDEGERDLFEEFYQQQTGKAIHIPREFARAKDEYGHTYFYDVDTGEILGREAPPRRPKWLHAVKG